MRRSAARGRMAHAEGTPGVAWSLLSTAAALALAAGAVIGATGVTTSNFTFTLSPWQLLPLVALFFAGYSVLGALVLIASLLLQRRDSIARTLERRHIAAAAAVSLWAWAGVTFLPLKGSETFVRAGGLSTLVLNAVGAAVIFVGGAVLGLVLSRAVAAVLSAIRSRMRVAARVRLAVALVAVALLAAVVGASVRRPGLGGRVTAGRAAAGVPARVLVVGVDGWDWERLGPLVEGGRMPTVARLMERGAYGPLTSMEPTISPRIWTSIATGKHPDKHGIKGFVNDAGVPVNSTMRRAAPIWSIASEQGLSVGIVGWYVTWPVDRVNGFMISDRVHSLLRGPVQVLQSLWGRSTNERLASFGRFSFDPGYKALPASDPRRELGRIVDEPLRWGYLRDLVYGRLAAWLLPAYRPALSAVYLRGVDFVQHFFWRFSDEVSFPDTVAADREAYGPVIAGVYEYEDRVIGRAIAALGEDTNVLIVSDHGFQAKTVVDPKQPELTGMHHATGVFIASGPAFRAAGRVERVTVLDVAPTVLAVMGLPVGEDMDGRVVEDIISPEHLEGHPIRTVPSYEPIAGTEQEEIGSTMDESIKEQLRSLGYLD